jgi:peptidyl-prolyl cis-trans isomerase D
MMSSMRKNMKAILWVVVLAFVGTIFFVWGMDLSRRGDVTSQGSAAMVNGQPISYSEFEQVYVQRVQDVFPKGEAEPPREQVQRLRRDLLAEMIDRLLLREQFAELGLKVLPEEVAARIASYPAFQQDGKFSEEKYLRLLQYNRIAPDQFEAEQAQTVAVLKMDRLLRDQVVVTEDQLRAYFLSRSRRLKVAWVTFNWKDRLPSVAVNDSELEAYYGQHRAEYDQPAEVRASHLLIRFEANASDEQKLAAKLKAENLRSEAVRGGDFAALARKHSEDPGSAAQGGDLGFFKAGMMVKPFEDAAFGLKVGDLSQPVETPFGYHLIKVTDRREAKHPAFAEVRPKLLERLREDKARQLAVAASREFMLALKAAPDLVKAAKTAGIRVQTRDGVTVDGQLPGLERSGDILDRAFDLPLDRPSSLLMAGETAVFVQVLAEQVQPFDEAKYQAQHDALAEKLRQLRGEARLQAWLDHARRTAKIVNNLDRVEDESGAEGTGGAVQ